MQTKLKLIAFAVATTVSLLSLSNPASAATKVSVGASKADCIAQQSANTDIPTLKKYGQARVASREKELAKFQDATLDKKYTNLENNFNTAKSAAEKKVGGKLNINKPATHQAQLIKERVFIANSLDTQKKAIEAGNDAASIANANCSIIWDLRVWSYVAPKFTYQYNLDVYAYKNSINKTLYKVAQDKKKTAGIKDPNELDKRIATLQATLDTITIAAAKPVDTTKFNPQGSAGKEVFSQKLADAKAVKSEINQANTKLKSATRAATQQKKSEKASNSSSSGGNSSSSSSGGSSSSSSSNSGGSSSSTSGSSSSSKDSKKKPSTPAKDSKFKKPKDVAKWCLDMKIGQAKNDPANRSCKDGAGKGWGSKDYGGDAAKACNVKGREVKVFSWCAMGFSAAYKLKTGKAATNSGYNAFVNAKVGIKASKDPCAASTQFKGKSGVITRAQQIRACRDGYNGKNCNIVYAWGQKFGGLKTVNYNNLAPVGWNKETINAGANACYKGHSFH